MKWQWNVRPDAPGPEVSQVRLQVREALAECHADDVGGAELLVWELMTNALLHTGTGAQVCVLGDGGSVRAEVSDGCNHPLEPRPSDPNRVGGHGLELVDALSRSWGVIDQTDGKTVWFEVQTADAGADR